MTNEPYTQRELKMIHDSILKEMKSISNSVQEMDNKLGIQNGKVARTEASLLDLRKIAEQNTTSIKAIITEREESKKKELSMLKKREARLRERFVWSIIVTILFILGFLGIINIDFIKAIL